MRLTTAYLNRVATTVPEHDEHDAFVIFAEQMLSSPRLRTVLRHIMKRADIAHCYFFLDAQKGSGRYSSHDADEFYRHALVICCTGLYAPGLAFARVCGTVDVKRIFQPTFRRGE